MRAINRDAFLRTKLNVVGCTLHDLVSAVAKENDSSLPNDQSVPRRDLDHTQ